MADPKDPDVTPENLMELYKLSLENLRYQHSDLWRGQQFYTTLNVGIITAAIALVRFFESGSENVPETFWIGPLMLFGVGTVTSFLGMFTVRQLRKYFLYGVARKTLFEFLLGYRKRITADKLPGFPQESGISLAVPPIYRDDKAKATTDNLSIDDRFVSKPDEWVKAHLIGRQSIATWFMIVQGIFVAVNIVLGVLVGLRII